jgi:hypothetical protein
LPSGAPDPDRIANGATPFDHQVEPTFIGSHHDRAARDIAFECDHLAGSGRGSGGQESEQKSGAGRDERS